MSQILDIDSLLNLVSEGTRKNAEKLVKNDKITDLGENMYLVAGSKAGDIYEIESDKNHGFVCRKTNTDNPNEKGSLCMGWKNSHLPKYCKHCIAVILYQKGQSK